MKNKMIRMIAFILNIFVLMYLIVNKNHPK